MKKRLFAIIWSILSLVGILLWNISPSYLAYFFFGFHTPNTALLLFGVLSIYHNHLMLALFILLVLLVFIFFWIISIIQIKKNQLFFYMILVDRLMALVLWIIGAIIIKNEFTGWPLLISLGIENFVIITVYCLSRLIKNKMLEQRTNFF